MSVRLRLFVPHRTVVRTRRPRTGELFAARWVTIHRRLPPWDRIYGDRLALLGLAATRIDEAYVLVQGGALRWHAGWRWTASELTLEAFSARKRRLIYDALVKAARYEEVKA